MRHLIMGLLVLVLVACSQPTRVEYIYVPVTTTPITANQPKVTPPKEATSVPTMLPRTTRIAEPTKSAPREVTLKAFECYTYPDGLEFCNGLGTYRLVPVTVKQNGKTIDTLLVTPIQIPYRGYKIQNIFGFVNVTAP